MEMLALQFALGEIARDGAGLGGFGAGFVGAAAFHLAGYLFLTFAFADHRRIAFFAAVAELFRGRNEGLIGRNTVHRVANRFDDFDRETAENGHEVFGDDLGTIIFRVRERAIQVAGLVEEPAG